MPTTAIAAVLVKSASPLEIAEFRLPRSLYFGQVLVQIHFSGVCSSQVHEIDARKGPDRFLPHMLGHEGVGTVHAVGEGVSQVVEGDTVVLHWRSGLGLLAAPPSYSWKEGALNAGHVTTFNSWAVVSENRVTTIPESIDLRIAPLLGCALTTGFGAVSNDARVKIGQSAVVFGAGGVGMAVIQALRMAGAFPIVAVDIHELKLTHALSLGATHAILMSDMESFINSFSNIIDENGAEVLFETTGIRTVIELAYKLTAPRGSLILIGVPEPGDPASLTTLDLHFGKIITGSHGGSTDPSTDIPRLVRLIEAGLLEFSKYPITFTPFEDINVALDNLRSGVPGRQIVKFTH